MTEEEWETCDDPRAMLVHLGTTTERKDRLLVVACCRKYVHSASNASVRPALAAAERHADGLLAASTLRRYRQKVGRVNAVGTSYETGALLTPERQATNLCLLAATSRASAGSSGPIGWQPVPGALYGGVLMGDFPTELSRFLPSLLRDIFGNPFRPITLDPSWLTSTVTTLARQMYESRDFSAMPILADALMDAGCSDDQVLSHCRGEGPHVRGCFVVDLLTGRE